ncbi:hypothetical protein HYV86_02115 [Candidatus Woesearchaeota archaeon]|nr:hypothetical protein [Candidatus Woesearchaeota archaeon]
MKDREIQLFTHALEYKIKHSTPTDIYAGYQIHNQQFTDQTLLDKLQTDPEFALHTLEPIGSKALEELLIISSLRLNFPISVELNQLILNSYERRGFVYCIEQLERILPQGAQTLLTTIQPKGSELVEVGESPFQELHDYLLGTITSSAFESDVCSAYVGALLNTYGILTPEAEERFERGRQELELIAALQARGKRMRKNSHKTIQ